MREPLDSTFKVVCSKLACIRGRIWNNGEEMGRRKGGMGSEGERRGGRVGGREGGKGSEGERRGGREGGAVRGREGEGGRESG